ncbi:MAG: DUF11 domain-containing protein, partial [Deltaproteobacteria bacterium]|nr:DUF11 domain-containing protein [Candidatus Zymogenaceae bacterium]
MTRLKPATTIRIVGIFLVLLLGAFSIAQDIGLTGPADLEISVCGEGEFTITVENGDTEITNLEVFAAVVPGGGSTVPISGEFSLVYGAGSPNPAPSSYSIDPATVTWEGLDLAADETWTGILRVSPQCDAFSNRQLVVMVGYDYYDGGTLVHVDEDPVFSGPLQVLRPNLYLELNPDVAFNAAPGDTVSWAVYVSNTGDGVLSGATVEPALPAFPDDGGLSNLTFTPPSGSPAPVTAPLPVPDLDAGAAPTLLGTVSADLTVGTEGVSCQNLYITVTGSHGCESGAVDECQPDIVVTGSVNLDYRTPNLSYTFSPSVVDSIPYCSESIPITVTVTNAGANAGNIVNLTMTVDAYGVAYTVVGDTFPDIDVVVDPGSNVFEFVDADNPTIEPSIIGPNDSYTFTFTAHRDECAAVDCTSLIFEPFFYDDCGDEFEPPIKELPINIAAPVGTDYDLTVTPDAGNPSIPDEGASLGYTITAVYNHSPGETEDMTADIVVELPLSFSIVTGPGNTDGGYVEGATATNTIITWEDAVFSSGSGWTVTKRLVLGAGYEDADCDDDFTLHFEVVPTSGMCDGECPPPGASANIALFSDTMIVVEKTAADGGDGIIYVGEPLDFSINVYYYGPRLMIGGSLVTPPAVVTDTLPAGFWIAESLPPDPPDPVVSPTPTSVTAGLLTWCLDAGELSQTGPVTFTYSLEPIPLGFAGYDPCLCGHEITNTATATLNTTGAVCAVPETSPLGCSDEDVLTFAYNCDYGDGTMGFVVEKEASPDSAERCDYDDGITFTNTITFNQAYPEGWDAITFTDNGNAVGLVFRDPDLYPGSYLSGTAHFAIVSGPSAGASEDYVITLGSSVMLGATGVGFIGAPQDGDVLEITYTLYFSDYSNGDGTAVVNWSDFLFPQTVTECTDDGGEAHAGAWVTPENPTPTLNIYNYCHYNDDDVCTYVINRCDTAKFRVYLSSTRVEYDVSVVIDLWGSGPDSNYTFNEETAFAPDFVNMYRPDGSTPVSGVPYTISGGGRYVTWQLGDLAPLGGDSYIEFYLDTACSGGTETTATVSTDGWCDDQVYTQTMAYSASRDQRQGELLVKKTPDRFYIKSLGEDLTWTIYVTNPGSGPATNITVFDTLGSGISYVSDSLRVNGIAVDPDDISPAVYDPLNPQQTIITLTIEDLDPGETAVIELTGHVENCTDRTNKTRATWGCLDETTGFIYCGEGESLEVTVQDYGTRVVISAHEADAINLCGGTSYVTVSFKNIGKAYAFDMVLTETLPTGIELDTSGTPPYFTVFDAHGNDVSAGVTLDFSTPGILEWTFPSTTPMKPVDGTGEGDEFTIRFPVKVIETDCNYASGTPMTASLSYATPCSFAESPAQDTVSTVFAPVLEIDKSPDNVAGDADDPIVWTIEINNPSYYTAEAVFLWDVPPPFFSSVAIVGGDFIPGMVGGRWYLGDIAPHDSMAFSAMGTLREDCTGGADVNTAWVEWCENCKDSASSNVSNVYSIPNLTADIDLDINYCGGPVTITIENNGSRAYSVVLTDQFPEGLAYVAGTTTIASDIGGRTFANEEPDYDAATNTLTWDSDNFAYIEKFETLTITFFLDNEVNVESASPEDEVCTTSFGPNNTVDLSYDDACENTYLLTPSLVTDVTGLLAIPVLTITKELDPDYGVIGETDPALWHVTIENTGGAAEGTVTVVDTFGNGWDVDTFSGPDTVGGTGTRSIVSIPTGGGTVTWTGGTLAAGATETLDIWVNPLNTSPEANLGNRVDVSGDCIGGCQFVSQYAEQNIVPGHSEIEKVYDRETATIGETVHVTITSSYYGSTTTYTNVSVVDTLPTGFIYGGNLSVTLDGTLTTITPDVSSPNDGTAPVTVSFDLGSFSFAASRVYVFEFDAVVANTAETDNGDTLTNNATTAYLVGGAPYTDSSEDTLTIIEAHLTLDKTYAVVGGGPVEASAVIEYTLTLANNGTSTAYDIDVEDTLGTGLTSPTWVSGGNSHDFASSYPTLLWHVDSLAVGASTTLVYRVMVQNSVTPCSMLNNEAVVTWTSLNGSVAEERT